jgi:hypothetical protein
VSGSRFSRDYDSKVSLSSASSSIAVTSLSPFELIYCALVVFVSYAVRGGTGFGAVIGMPLIALGLPMKDLVPVWDAHGFYVVCCNSRSRSQARGKQRHSCIHPMVSDWHRYRTLFFRNARRAHACTRAWHNGDCLRDLCDAKCVASTGKAAPSAAPRRTAIGRARRCRRRTVRNDGQHLLRNFFWTCARSTKNSSARRCRRCCWS